MVNLEDMLRNLAEKKDYVEKDSLKDRFNFIEENPLDLGKDLTDYYQKEVKNLTKKLKGTTDPASLYYLGQYKLRAGSKKSAMATFNKIIKENPDSPFGYLGRGFYYSSQDKDEEAKAEFEKAIELDPNNWHGHLGIGEIYFAYDKFEKAESAFNKAKKLHPSNTTTSDLYLHDCYIKQGKYEEAIAMCENIAHTQFNSITAFIELNITVKKWVNTHLAKLDSIVKKK